MLGAMVVSAPLVAAELGQATIEAWNRYVQAAESRIALDLEARDSFLWPVNRAELSSGRIVVQRHREEGARDLDVPSGTIYHWRGAVFVPGVTVEEVLAELQSPDGARHRQEDVLEWRLLSGGGDTARVFLKLRRKEIVTVTYNTEHDVEYLRHGPGRASSKSVAVRIAELADAGTPKERERPVGRDRGFLWRLNAYWRYEQTDRGVILQVESLSLSRHVPLLLKPIAKPIIDSIARESMVRTLEAVRARMARLKVSTSGR
jgi:hypothetical protein